MSVTTGEFGHRVTVQTLTEKKRKREPSFPSPPTITPPPASPMKPAWISSS